ncbi:STAS domain-containing protein [Devosia sp. SL43]|uniref:STAS domain-containing protein n=1 Tax=Devosia sp. SL43 TaxID=2806348 RepID=UPI001F32DB84|nr:STAS domain-containing protein [Devosia sp. SL43]UJW85026.1 STAS domain-containing protein [Devosia sp. SL43]
MTRDSVFLTNISGDAGLRNAQDIAAQLKAALVNHNAIAAATDDIASADITTVQLLLAARRQAVAAGKSFTLAAPPHGALRDLLIQIGILDAAGTAATSDADFWLHEPQKTKGKAA